MRGQHNGSNFEGARRDRHLGAASKRPLDCFRIVNSVDSVIARLGTEVNDAAAAALAQDRRGRRSGEGKQQQRERGTCCRRYWHAVAQEAVAEPELEGEGEPEPWHHPRVRVRRRRGVRLDLVLLFEYDFIDYIGGLSYVYLDDL